MLNSYVQYLPWCTSRTLKRVARLLVSFVTWAWIYVPISFKDLNIFASQEPTLHSANWKRCTILGRPLTVTMTFKRVMSHLALRSHFIGPIHLPEKQRCRMVGNRERDWERVFLVPSWPNHIVRHVTGDAPYSFAARIFSCPVVFSINIWITWFLIFSAAQANTWVSNTRVSGWPLQLLPSLKTTLDNLGNFPLQRGISLLHQGPISTRCFRSTIGCHNSYKSTRLNFTVLYHAPSNPDRFPCLNCTIPYSSSNAIPSSFGTPSIGRK